MANDRDRDQKTSQSGAGESRGKDKEQHTFGKGMTSPDSTEAVLDASTGESDPRARGEGASRSAKDQDLEQDV